MVARNLREIIPAFFVGPGGQPLTEEQAKTRQELAESLLAQATDTSPTAGGWTSVLAKSVQGLAAGRQRHRAEEGLRLAGERDADLSRSLLSGVSLGSPAATSSLPLGAAPVGAVASQPLDPISQRVSDAHTVGSILPPSMLSAIDNTEGGGAYDTLFGYANRSGPFAGVDVSSMSIGDALAFADPSGAYAQHVKNQIGRVATPMGRHQIVGTTLRNAVNQLGIDPSTPFNSTTQDAIALHLAKNRVNSASSLDGKISALRSEWEGFKNVPRDRMAQIVAEVEAAPDPAQILRGVPLPAGIGSESLVGRPLPEGIEMEPMAYAPQHPQGGPLAAAPFESAGLPVAPVTEDVIVATTPEEVLAAEMATGMIPDPLSLPENQITMDYVEPQGGGGAYVDPVVAMANPNGIADLGPGSPGEKRRGPDGQMYQYVETSGMAGASGGWGWIRVADDGGAGGLTGQVGPNDPGMWGMGMDPNNPATIPAMAGGTRDVITALDPAMGYFPPAPSASRNAFPPAPTAQAAASSPSPMGGGASVGGVNPAIIEALSSPYASAQTKQIAGMLLEQQMQAQDPMRALQLEKARLELDAMRNPQPQTTTEMQNLAWRAAQAGLQPGTQEYAEFMMTGGRPSDGVNVTVNTGEGDKFYEELDKGNAQMFQQLQQGGIEASQNLVRIQRLDELLSNVPTGMKANFQLLAGSYGINTEGLSDIQAAQALINQMVPAQRPPGSGPMSDSDLELFKQSVPSIINQPGGNRIILDTMRGIAEYTMQQARIADMVANREIAPAEGRRMLSALDNPLEKFRADAAATGGGLPEPKSKAEMDALPRGTRFRAPDGSIRIKP